MKRRRFIRLCGLAALAPTVALPVPAVPLYEHKSYGLGVEAAYYPPGYGALLNADWETRYSDALRKTMDSHRAELFSMNFP